MSAMEQRIMAKSQYNIYKAVFTIYAMKELIQNCMHQKEEGWDEEHFQPITRGSQKRVRVSGFNQRRHPAEQRLAVRRPSQTAQSQVVHRYVAS
jgi:hypothetical protein